MLLHWTPTVSICVKHELQWPSPSEYIKASMFNDDVIKWKHFSRYWSVVQGIHRSSVNSPNKGQWRGALLLSLIYAWIKGWVNNGEAGHLRRHRAHYDVILMRYLFPDQVQFSSTNDRPYTIADLGCREGGTSIPIIQGLIGEEFCLISWH